MTKLAKCNRCGGSIKERVTTRKASYHYEISGLDNIYLADVTLSTCTKCRASFTTIPRLGELSDVIAETLASKPELLTGDELRYLRKHAEFSAVKFAERLGVVPAHLSRVENGKAKLGVAPDRLARAISMAALNHSAVRRILLGHEEHYWVARNGRLLFELGKKKNQWRAAA